MAAVYGSVIGSTITAYTLGDERTRTTIHFLTPFLLLGAIATAKLLSEPPPPSTKLIKLVPFNEID